MRKMPIGIQSFENIITNDYVYADKTAYAYKLATEGKVYFLARPRRFGKSLLISTLEAYFKGKRDLFEGLALAELEQDWVKHPVLHIDLTGVNYKEESADHHIDPLEKVLNAVLSRYEEEWCIVPEDAANTTSSLRFEALIREASLKSGKGVVVLIDEYDKPLLESLDDIRLNDHYCDSLRAFYGVLKKTDQYLRFVLLTGVTKFSKVSVFSDLNQLRDISLLDDYASICGITQSELESVFEPELAILSDRNHQTQDQALEQLKQLYDGYHFSKRSEDIYNPFSVLNTFANREYDYYWFKTGTPTFLIKLIQQSNFDTLQFQDGINVSIDALDDFRIGSPNPIPVLYQSGYLTIKHYERSDNSFTLGFPNDEVEYGFLSALLPAYLEQSAGFGDFDALKFKNEILRGDIDGFLSRLKALFASLPYGHGRESEHYYQSIFYLVFTLVGQYIKVEEHTSKGRSDAVVITADAVYVFEFKLQAGDGDQIADAALAQIEEKGYAAPYMAGDKNLIKIGVQFDPDVRNITKWKIIV
jgi:hypothetical protein